MNYKHLLNRGPVTATSPVAPQSPADLLLAPTIRGIMLKEERNLNGQKKGTSREGKPHPLNHLRQDTHCVRRRIRLTGDAMLVDLHSFCRINSSAAEIERVTKVNGDHKLGLDLRATN